MKRLKLLLSYFLLTYIWGIHAKAPSNSLSYKINANILHDSRDITPMLIDENLNATDALKEILLLTGIQSDSLDACVKDTQERWIAVMQGKNGKERRDLIEPQEYNEIKPRILEIIENIGLLNNQPPLSKHYDYAICLGAFLETARSRLGSLIEDWKNGVRFDYLVFLGSNRPLRKGPGDNESFTHLCDPSHSTIPFRANWQPPKEDEIVYNTEHDMHLLIWDQADVPEDMRQHLEGRVLFVDTPSPAEGLRASTHDTYMYWKEHYNPKPGSVLAASSPGIWCYQHLVGINVLGPEFSLETTAPQLVNKEHLQVIVILDTLAKCLYMIDQIRSSSAL